MRISNVLHRISDPDPVRRRRRAKQYVRRCWPAGLYRPPNTRYGAPWRDQARQALVRRDGVKCSMCSREPTPAELRDGGFPTWLQVDHREPLELDGEHSIDNLRLLCAGCNRQAWRDAQRQDAQREAA